MVEAKVIGTHVTRFFCVDKLVWSKERGKAQKLSPNSYQNELHSHTNLTLSRLLLGFNEIVNIVGEFRRGKILTYDRKPEVDSEQKSSEPGDLEKVT